MLITPSKEKKAHKFFIIRLPKHLQKLILQSCVENRLVKTQIGNGNTIYKSLIISTLAIYSLRMVSLILFIIRNSKKLKLYQTRVFQKVVTFDPFNPLWAVSWYRQLWCKTLLLHKLPLTWITDMVIHYISPLHQKSANWYLFTSQCYNSPFSIEYISSCIFWLVAIQALVICHYIIKAHINKKKLCWFTSFCGRK